MTPPPPRPFNPPPPPAPSPPPPPPPQSVSAKMHGSFTSMAVRRYKLESRIGGRTSIRVRFGSPFSSKLVVYGHCLASVSPPPPPPPPNPALLTVPEKLKQGNTATNLTAEIIRYPIGMPSPASWDLDFRQQPTSSETIQR